MLEAKWHQIPIRGCKDRALTLMLSRVVGRVRVTPVHFDRGEGCRCRPANLISSFNSMQHAWGQLASNSDQRMQRSSTNPNGVACRFRVRVTPVHFDLGEGCRCRPANLISSFNSIRQCLRPNGIQFRSEDAKIEH